MLFTRTDPSGRPLAMNKTNNEGWIKLHRQMFGNDLWLSEPFTKAQAWIDLFGNANHKDRTISIRGAFIEIKKGQIGWSELTMAKRWQWSRDKVRRFLKWLETRQQIRQQKNSYTSVISILNYKKFQSPDTSDNTSNKTADNTTEKHQKNIRRYTNKNVKNDKNEKKDIYITSEKILEIAERYGVSEKSVKETYEDLILYCKSKGKTYKDYEAALMTWVRNNIKSGKTKIVPQTIKVEPISEFTDEQRQNNLKRLAEMRAKLPIILHQ